MPNIVVGTAGHIDHGKSTLVLALTGTDPDRLKEEKERGITIELGFAHAIVGNVQVAFVDVPGHERFVRTMLAGVGGIDCVLLIVACDESVMPQTREHFDICRLLQIPDGIIVLTKSDTVDADMRGLVLEEVRELVRGSFLEGAQVVEVSARTGEGLDDLRAAIVACSARARPRPVEGAARLPIDRAFSMRGFGTVITGTLVAGRIRPDDELSLVPGERVAKVRGVQVHGSTTSEAVAGQRTAVNLGGLEVGDVARGQTLAAAGSLTVTRRVDAAFDSDRDHQAVEARRACARAQRHERDSRTGVDRRHGRLGDRAGFIGARSAAAGVGRGVDARRSLHRPRLLAADHHRRRPRARPGANSPRHPFGSQPDQLAEAERQDGHQHDRGARGDGDRSEPIRIGGG